MPKKGWHHSEESREKMSKSQKKRFSDPEEFQVRCNASAQKEVKGMFVHQNRKKKRPAG